MPAAVTAKQIFDRLSPYDLNRVTFQMPDGLPVVFAAIDTDETGGALITLSDDIGDLLQAPFFCPETPRFSGFPIPAALRKISAKPLFLLDMRQGAYHSSGTAFYHF